MARYATIDIGTNSVLLLVAERSPGGGFTPVVERAEITRLGRGVDQTKRLLPEAIDDTLRVVKAFADEARALGAEAIAVSATSAARDAQNGAELLREAKERAGVEVEILSGDLEAALSYAAAQADLGGDGPLVMVDIGGGSTEVVFGRGQELSHRRSIDVGSVRLTERFVRSDPPSKAEREALEAHLFRAFAELPAPPAGFRLVGIAGTVTTLYAVHRAIEPYDGARVHGQVMTKDEVREVTDRLYALPLATRRTLPGLQPKRADVIPAGGSILLCAMERLCAERCIVSDRGLRWGLLFHRFG